VHKEEDLAIKNKQSSGRNEQSLYAVLTGDIVASSKISPARLKDVMQRLRDGAVRFEKKFTGSVYGKLDVYSGDSWQLLMTDYGLSLRAAIFLRAIIKSYRHAEIDTRVAVAWGNVNKSSLNPRRISESTGEAFTESGRALENIKKDSRLVWHPAQTDDSSRILESAIKLLDTLAARWTARQSEIITWTLLGFNQEQVGSKLKISQSAVNQALHGAGWTAIEDFLNETNYCVKKL